MPNEKKSTKTLTIVGFVGVFLAILVFSFGVPEGGCGGEVELASAPSNNSQETLENGSAEFEMRTPKDNGDEEVIMDVPGLTIKLCQIERIACIWKTSGKCDRETETWSCGHVEINGVGDPGCGQDHIGEDQVTGCHASKGKKDDPPLDECLEHYGTSTCPPKAWDKNKKKWCIPTGGTGGGTATCE